MSNLYYTIQLDGDVPVVILETLEDVYDFLKKKKVISVLRYNDNKTGSAYAKAAKEQSLTTTEQEQTPVYIKTVLSDEGTFVEDEAFWIENYMLDEFYVPERMPFIDTIIKHNGEDL